MLVQEQGDQGSVHHGVEALLLESLGWVLKRKDEDVKLYRIARRLVVKTSLVSPFTALPQTPAP